ncbi:MAG: hypothetical protein WA865_22865, partial [Spirulinaceae cyanobacterium]
SRPESEEAIAIKTNIIEKLSTYCWWRNQELKELFTAEIQAIKSELKQKIQDLWEFQINQTTNCLEIAKSLIEEAVILKQQYEQKLITDNFINTLAAKVKHSPENSSQRRVYTQWLLKAMDTKNVYKRVGLGANFNLSRRDYEEAFYEAKKESIIYTLKRISEYDESKNFMALINYWIAIKFSDAAGQIIGLKKSQSRKAPEDKVLINIEDPTSRTFSNQSGDYEEKFACNQRSEELKTLVKEHPKLNKKIRKTAKETFADILIGLYWEGETFENLSQKWNIPQSTISTFYYRERSKVKPYLREILQ